MNKTKFSSEEFERNLAQFTGTESYHRWNKMLFPRMVMTDGVKYVASELGAYWLMDLIASVAPKLVDSGHRFMVAWIDVREEENGDRNAEIIIDDGNWSPKNDPTQQFREKLHVQATWTDFPADKLKLYIQPTFDNLILIMRPSEY